MCETWLVWWGNGSCSVIISCCWTRTDILIFFSLWKTNECMCVAISIFSNTVSHMTTHQITQFIKQNLNLKAHPFLHNLIYYKRIFILRYNFFEHLKNIHGEYIQKCQNHKNCWELQPYKLMNKEKLTNVKAHTYILYSFTTVIRYPIKSRIMKSFCFMFLL